MHIPQETIDRVRDRADIAEIIKRYVPSLKKKGKNYFGLCPFHQEKTPSFSVSTEKEIFHCFGCHAGGNVFTFISKIEGLTFPESVQHVADIYGIEITTQNEESKSDTSHFDEALRITRYATELYSRFLHSENGQNALDYLSGRGVPDEAITRYTLGYAPDSWDFLTSRLKSHGADLEIAVELGLIGKKEKETGDRYYDRFRNRVLFPIFDRKSRPIGFGGRIIGEGEPKYLNSSESILFQKRYNLYGLHHASGAIREMDRAIVVEGYLDVIACHQAGIENVVAPLGTALTAEQVRLLSRMAGEIIVLFDGDQAGYNAALRVLDLEKSSTARFRVALLPEGDPFDFLKDHSPRELMAIVDSAPISIDFRINTHFRNWGGRPRDNEFLNGLFAILRDLQYDTERDSYIDRLASRLQVQAQSLAADYRRFANATGPKDTTYASIQQQAPSEKKGSSLSNQYIDFIALLCAHPSLLDNAIMDIQPEEIHDEPSRNIYHTMLQLHRDGNFSVNKLFDFFQGGYEMEQLSLCLEREFPDINPLEVYTEIYISMRVREIDGRIRRYVNQLKGSPEDGSHFISEIEILRREKERLSHYLQHRGLETGM